MRRLLMAIAALSFLALDADAGLNRWTSAGPDGGVIRALAIDPSNAHIYAGTEAGIFRSVDGGETWQLFNDGLALPPSPFLPRVAAFAFTPTTLYAGAGSRVFRMMSGGSGWTVTAPLGSLIGGVGVVALAVDPTNPNIVYAGADGGVYKSTDGGASWVLSSNGISCFYVSALAIDPANPATLYAASCGSLLKTTNGAESWTASGSGIPAFTVLFVAVDPRTPSIVYAGTTDGIFRSSDGAATWTKASTGLPPFSEIDTLAVDPDDSSTLYAGETSGALFKSFNGGSNWLFGDASLGRVNVLALRSSRIFAGTSIGVFRNENRGSPPWTFISRGIRAREVSILALDRATSALYVVDDDDSVLKSTDQGDSWESRNTGITEGVRSLAVDPTTANTIYASTRDGMFKSMDGGASWVNRSTGLPPDFATEKLVIGRSNPQTLYASEFDFRFHYKTMNGGASWNYIGTLNARILAVDPTNADVAYAGGGETGRGVLKSVDGGANWTPINTGLDPFVYVLAMTVDPNQPSTVYCGTSEHGIFKSVNGGATWTAINQGLPTDFDLRQLGVREIVVDPTNSWILYAATASKGVFRSFDGGAHWSPFSDGLTSGLVFGLVIDDTGKFLHAATYTGLFSLEIAANRRRVVRH